MSDVNEYGLIYFNLICFCILLISYRLCCRMVLGDQTIMIYITADKNIQQNGNNLTELLPRTVQHSGGCRQRKSFSTLTSRSS